MVYLNETATTESFTYQHTLSRHDSLPICIGERAHTVSTGRGRNRTIGRRRRGPRFGPRSEQPATQTRFSRPADYRWRDEHPCTPDRSEEHTSELQSLMRTSYALFSLNKKQSIIQPIHSKQRT